MERFFRLGLCIKEKSMGAAIVVARPDEIPEAEIHIHVVSVF